MKNIRTIEGRLLMADFKEHGTRCRIHPSASDPVLAIRHGVKLVTHNAKDFAEISNLTIITEPSSPPQ